jgi:hypothetical protein
MLNKIYLQQSLQGNGKENVVSFKIVIFTAVEKYIRLSCPYWKGETVDWKCLRPMS